MLNFYNNLLHEEDQLRRVKQDAFNIRFIKNPTEKVQLEAVNENVKVARFIDNPTEKVQLVVINEHSFAIQCIKNPSEKIQLKALENYWTKYFYEVIIKDLPNKTDWFYREFNRLKLTKGPLV